MKNKFNVNKFANKVGQMAAGIGVIPGMGVTLTAMGGAYSHIPYINEIAKMSVDNGTLGFTTAAIAAVGAIGGATIGYGAGQLIGRAAATMDRFSKEDEKDLEVCFDENDLNNARNKTKSTKFEREGAVTVDFTVVQENSLGYNK
ncbi:MAG: hypothetical protein N4A47_07040 [Clostridia bacterium]|jgi:membrane protein DedA with SNARE-associated domain|nr:hypothetical protein [Clostridia bacterium]